MQMLSKEDFFQEIHFSLYLGKEVVSAPFPRDLHQRCYPLHGTIKQE